MCAGRSQSKLEIGYKSHLLTVISGEIPGTRNPSTSIKYETVCECGVVSLKSKRDLVSGRIKSCGCVNSPIGKKFNQLTVVSLSRTESYVQDNGTKQNINYFECACDCGNTKIIRQASLGNTLSCGCQQTRENQSRAKDVTGQKFSRLTAIIRDTNSGKWLCRCECGKEVFVRLATLTNGDTKSCGCLQKEKASTSITNQHKAKRRERGLPEDIPMSTEYNLERLEFKPLSAEILKRDLFTCAWCSQKSGELNVHHLKTWISSPELRFTPSNLVTLCVPCHKRVHKDGNSTVNPYMTILLQGYSNIMEDDKAARLNLTPN